MLLADRPQVGVFKYYCQLLDPLAISEERTALSELYIPIAFLRTSFEMKCAFSRKPLSEQTGMTIFRTFLTSLQRTAPLRVRTHSIAHQRSALKRTDISVECHGIKSNIRKAAFLVRSFVVVWEDRHTYQVDNTGASG
jgi:hypothetical protein